MKFVSVEIRNYRLIGELKVDFNPDLTLIGGPNETGKSTIVEAIHRVLFAKADSNSELVKSMKSNVHEGAPEVKLTFEWKGREYRLTKKFGAKGKTILEADGQPSLQDSEAEEEMKSLLDVSVDVYKKQVQAKWRHLWIWQGQSAENPAVQLDDVSSKLEERLSSMASGLAVRSQQDKSIQDHFKSEFERCFTEERRTVRRGSSLHSAIGRCETALEARNSAQKAWTHLEDMATRLPKLTEQRSEMQKKADQLNQRRVELQKISEKLMDLSTKKSDRERRLSECNGTLQRLREVDDTIKGFRKDIQEILDETKPVEKAISDMQVHIEGFKREHSSMLEKRDRIDGDSREVGGAIDFLRPLIEKKRIEEELVQVVNSIQTAEGLVRQIADIDIEIGRLPKIDEKSLEKLRAIDQKLSTARTALESISTELLLEEADETVQLDGLPLSAGMPRNISEASRLTIGKGVRLKITPGGGTTLQTAISNHSKLSQQWEQTISELGVKSLQDASDCLFKIQDLRKRQIPLQANLDLIDVDSCLAKEKTLGLEKTRLDLRLSELEDRPDFKDWSDSIRQDLQHRLDGLETRKRSLNGESDALSARIEALTKRLAKLEADVLNSNKTLKHKREDVSAKQNNIQFLESSNGDDADRGKRIKSLIVEKEKEGALLESIQAEIDELNPSGVRNEMKRLEESIPGINELINDVRNRIAETEYALRTDGHTDPESNLLNSENALRTAENDLRLERLKADSITLLVNLFEEGHLERTRAFIKPLSDKIVTYMEILFGKGVTVMLEYKDNRFEGVSVGRPCFSGNKALDFEVLSGGTKEQIAAAVRLATAEVLASANGGTIPMVLDDAFVNTDKDRIEKVLDMLYHASQNGVQVTVLTCSPEDYLSVGRKPIELSDKAG